MYAARDAQSNKRDEPKHKASQSKPDGKEPGECQAIRTPDVSGGRNVWRETKGAEEREQEECHDAQMDDISASDAEPHEPSSAEPAHALLDLVRERDHPASDDGH